MRNQNTLEMTSLNDERIQISTNFILSKTVIQKYSKNKDVFRKNENERIYYRKMHSKNTKEIISGEGNLLQRQQEITQK